MHGRFCQVCGQENIEPKESFWHLVTHFMYDITHFDGKFFSTLKYLLFKPGFLSHEYLRGRRASYLHPIRMYVFTSAFFFLIFFSMNKDEDVVKMSETETSAASVIKNLERRKGKLQKELNDSMSDMMRKPILKSIQMMDSDIAMVRKDTTNKNKLKTEGGSFNIFSISSNNVAYKNQATYDSVQKQLPPAKRDNFIERKLAKQTIHLKEKYKGNSKAIWGAIADKAKHLFPQMLFVSLPLFALMLQLLYARRRNFFYVNHVVYTIHLYCATFIIILLGILTDSIFAMLGAEEHDLVGGMFTLAAFFYWYKAMRNFYEQRRAKTVLKYMLVFFLSLFIMAFIFSLFFIFSAMSI